MIGNSDNLKLATIRVFKWVLCILSTTEWKKIAQTFNKLLRLHHYFVIHFKTKLESLFNDFVKIKMLTYDAFVNYSNNLKMYNKIIFHVEVKILIC